MPPHNSGALASNLAKFQQSHPGDALGLDDAGSKTQPKNNDTGPSDYDPLPRPDRRRRRDKADRGLPSDEDLKTLARAYLDRQRQHWRELFERGFLAEPTPEVLSEMVENFKKRHRSGKCEGGCAGKIAAVVTKLGGSYCRYSCDNSSPTSIVDQLMNILDRAHNDRCFVPWDYVFCDYSISGLDSSRQGYSSYKAVLADDRQSVATTYIDDFTRASRDEIEWWQLAALCKRLGKGLIGASDGFNLADANSDVIITIDGLVSRLHIKGLREKVKRGMKGAARRGGCLGKLPLGLTKRTQRDEIGNPITRPDGGPRYEPCIDPATSEHAEMLFRLFAVDRETTYKIVKKFNELRVDDWSGWTESALKKLLANPAFIGVVIWNQTRHEFDWDREKTVVVENPKSEWEYYYDPSLAIISQDQWFAARTRLADARCSSPLTGRTPSRNQVSATTLFSGTLFCGYCTNERQQRELTLIRSAGKYKSMSCVNGPTGMHGCRLSTSKSTRIIEECLLEHIRSSIITEAALHNLVIKANEFLVQQASKPRIDTSRLRAAARAEESAITKLVGRVESATSEEVIAVYEQRITTRRKNLERLRREIQDAESQNATPPELLDLDRVKTYVADLRGLLTQNIPASAEAIRVLTGKILIRQEPIPGRKNGAKWIATFSPDLLQILARVAKDNRYPDSITLEYLSTRNWITPSPVEVPLEHVPQYERLGPTFKALYDRGTTIPTIAAAHGMSTEQAITILRFAQTGERPRWKNHHRNDRAESVIREPIYTKIASAVAEWREHEGLSWPRIQQRLAQTEGIKCCEATVKRAYDYAHREEAQKAAERGQDLDRSSSGYLGKNKRV
jgi:DNA invertase Pin-like site-specific DNA recombinase